MSPNVNNFVHDLVEMARALEAEPGYQATIRGHEAEAIIYRETIMNLELNAINRKAEIEDLHRNLREVQKERDDALFRTLEAEDKLASVLRSLRGIQSDTASLVEVIDPSPRDANSGQFLPREAVLYNDDMAEFTMSINDPQQNWGEASAASVSPAPGDEPIHSQAGEYPNPSWENDPEYCAPYPFDPAPTPTPTPPVQSEAEFVVPGGSGMGESVSHPTTAPIPSSDAGQMGDLNVDNAVSGSTEGVSVPSDPTPATQTDFVSQNPVKNLDVDNTDKPRPYANLYYINVPRFLSRAEWLAGGGTDFTYDYRR